MSEEMESKGIFFDIQWKTKTSSGEECASIGIWEVDDSSLDWSNFKPYLCQTLGNVQNLSISYVDSDGDLIPIDSDCEFQEALKYARRKAAIGQKLILEVERLDPHSASAGGGDLSSSHIHLKAPNFLKERFKIHTNNSENPICFYPNEIPINLSCKVKSKSRAKDAACPMQSCDSPPLWFKKYMQKMKGEIIFEVTENVTRQMKKLLENQGHNKKPISVDELLRRSGLSYTDAALGTKTKKKVSDDDSSDGAHKVEIKDSKSLKKIEKLHKREKKLDHKKEKLEQKSKKIAERKEREYLSKLRLERAGWKRSQNDSLSHKHKEPEYAETQIIPPREWEEPVLAFKLSAGDQRTISVKRGSKFTKVWKVVNSGNVSWTDETELKLSWGNAGLEAEAFTVKCPTLSPGEEGDISVNFTAPGFPGLFESHWHIFHKNVRFGNSISCIVSVDLISNAEDKVKSEQGQSPVSSAEFCVSSNGPLVEEGENEKLILNEAQNGSSSLIEAISLEKILPKLNSFTSASIPWETMDNVDELAEKEVIEESKMRKETEYGSITTDDGSASVVEETEKRKEIEFGSITTEDWSGSVIEETKKRKETGYESITTDDWSGSVGSLGSNSDDNFVVVPMPPCFRFDVPLNSGVVPTKEESAVTKDESASSNSPKSKSPQTSIENTETASIRTKQSIQERSEVSCDTGEVISMPVPPPEMPLVAELRPSDLISTPPRHSLEPVLPPPIQPTMLSAAQSTSRNSPQSSSPPPNIKVSSNSSTSPRESPMNSSSPSPTANIPTAQPRRLQSPRPRIVNLLPPVVSEVWDVATSALKASISVIDTVMGPSVSSEHAQNSTPNNSDPLEPKMVEDLSHLASMGFCNIEVNEALLRIHNHNITEVVDYLLDHGDDE